MMKNFPADCRRRRRKISGQFSQGLDAAPRRPFNKTRQQRLRFAKLKS
jgi:hypothetical protein